MTAKALDARLGSGWMQVAATATLMALGLLIPSLGLPQAITGPLVNALLILSVVTMGIGPAMWVGMTTPLGALAHGVLPLPLMVMVPFIALANGALVVIYGVLRSRIGAPGALVAAALAKFSLLSLSVTYLVVRPISLLVNGAPQSVTLPGAIVEMMQWPQLATALAGGLIAWGVLAGSRAVRAR